MPSVFSVSTQKTQFRLIVLRIVTSLLFFAIIPVTSQTDEQKIKEADQKFEDLAYITARDIYLEVATKGYTSYNIYRKLADSFYFTGEEEASVEWYEKLVYTYKDSISPEYLFRYAQSLKSIKKYKKSDQVMERFQEKAEADSRAIAFANQRDYLNFIEIQSGKFTLFPLSVNSPYSDYAPSFTTSGELVFASSRNKNSKVHNWNNMPFLDLYQTKIGENPTDLSTPEKLKGSINTRYHESSSTFTKDGKTVYFTRNNFLKNNLKKSKKGIVLLKIYKATYEKGKYQNIEEVPFNSNNYSTSHPALGHDDKRLYFASDMPGTYGKSDIFYVDLLDNDSYSDPVNLGPLVNTEGRETFPFISAENKLYFSSDGHIGLGGLDIFISEERLNAFKEAYNVGQPINSQKDDFSFVINESTKIGYFASNRAGGKGSDDIYSFKQNEDLISSCNEYVRGIVIDEKTEEIVAGALVELIGMDGKVYNEMQTGANGAYEFKVNCDSKYMVRTHIPPFNPNDRILVTRNRFEKKTELNVLFKKEKLLSKEQQALQPEEDIVKTLELTPIFFDLDTEEIRPDAIEDLQKVISIMQKNPDMKIEVRSHTDSRSSFWYNKQLSIKRVRATVAYLTDVGKINWRRIAIKAYGERKLINHCKDDVPCSEKEHQENRRSEFIVKYD